VKVAATSADVDRCFYTGNSINGVPVRGDNNADPNVDVANRPTGGGDATIAVRISRPSPAMQSGTSSPIVDIWNDGESSVQKQSGTKPRDTYDCPSTLASVNAMATASSSSR